MTPYHTIIVGAGPAGLFCAAHLADLQDQVLILEKNEQAGRKLLLTGGGHCNLTHQTQPSEIIQHYGDKNRQVKPALFQFSPERTREWFETRGLALITDEEGRVLPASDRAEDVLQVLLDSIPGNITLQYNSGVESLDYSEGIFKVSSRGKHYQSHRLVIATGGMSYALTGSSGDAYPWLKKWGHSIVPPRPALTPLLIRDFGLSYCAGISFRNIALSLWRETRKQFSLRGDVLLTHQGLSGPAALNLSRWAESGDTVRLTLLSDDPQDFEKTLQAASHERPRNLVRTWLQERGVAQRLAETLMNMYKLPVTLALSELTRERRRMVMEMVLELPLVVEKRGDFRMAIVTQGGVDLVDIDLKTMASRHIPGLYCIGEVLDVDGDSGGYNLQWAWSSAWTAAQSIKVHS